MFDTNWYEVHQTLDVDWATSELVRPNLDEVVVELGASIELHRFYNEAVGYQRLDIVTGSHVQGWDDAYKLAIDQKTALERLGFDVLRTKIEAQPWVMVPPNHLGGTYYETHVKVFPTFSRLPGVLQLSSARRPSLWSRNALTQRWVVTFREEALPEPNEGTLRSHLVGVAVQMERLARLYRFPWIGEPRTELVLLDDNRALDAEWERMSCA